ncbi:Protein of unknown function [Azospirillum lipoferum 4B]|uniref:Uncharacterized protein n=1 Tax=Azospirillum lipoferum (strain 4B) TaxID=862719 RepID=G7Z9I5_AZOL4|nr:Protein of unknown function [Azospirillum lipoferum 4B]
MGRCNRCCTDCCAAGATGVAACDRSGANLWQPGIPPLRIARLAKRSPAALASFGHTNERSQ